jgi:hypothetical protein
VPSGTDVPVTGPRDGPPLALTGSPPGEKRVRTPGSAT